MKLPTVFAVAALALCATPALAEDFNIGSLSIASPWSPATPKGASVGAGYFKLTNKGTVPDRLIGGSAAASGEFELHEMTMSEGIMRMRPVKGGLEIKPGQTVELKPGSYHIMLVDLKEALRQGQHFKGTLTFEKAGSVDIDFTVVPMGSRSANSR
jgi:periplasmic copper chaperone A